MYTDPLDTSMGALPARNSLQNFSKCTDGLTPGHVLEGCILECSFGFQLWAEEFPLTIYSKRIRLYVNWTLYSAKHYCSAHFGRPGLYTVRSHGLLLPHLLLLKNEKCGRDLMRDQGIEKGLELHVWRQECVCVCGGEISTSISCQKQTLGGVGEGRGLWESLFLPDTLAITVHVLSILLTTHMLAWPNCCGK